MNSLGATVSKNNFCSIYELERLKGADNGRIRCRETWVVLTQNIGLQEKIENFVQEIIENLFTETLPSITLFLNTWIIQLHCKKSKS